MERHFEKFIAAAIVALESDPTVIGLAAGGSLASNELDQYSDLDLILVTNDKVSGKEAMVPYAARFGNLLSAFTGEHVSEPRLLICLYSDPLLHVDIKFLTLTELYPRVEEPVLLLDKDKQLYNTLRQSAAAFPHPDYQWIEDRFWTWIHYLLLKVGRGEFFEAADFLAYLRMTVFGPLLHISNGNLPRGVRKVETSLSDENLALLKLTLASHDRESLIAAADHAITVYRQLRSLLYGTEVTLQSKTEEQVVHYLEEMKYP